MKCKDCKWWDRETLQEEAYCEPGMDFGEPCTTFGTRSVAICRENSNYNKTQPYGYCGRFEPIQKKGQK